MKAPFLFFNEYLNIKYDANCDRSFERAWNFEPCYDFTVFNDDMGICNCKVITILKFYIHNSWLNQAGK